MAALRELGLHDVTVQNLPDLIRLTDLQSLIIDAYGESGKELSDELEYLPAGFGELGLLKDLKLCRLVCFAGDAGSNRADGAAKSCNLLLPKTQAHRKTGSASCAEEARA